MSSACIYSVESGQDSEETGVFFFLVSSVPSNS